MKRPLFWTALALAVVAKRPLHALVVRKPGARAPLAKLFDVVGSGYAMTAFGAALFGIAACTNDPRFRIAARRFAASGIAGWTLFRATSFVLAEERPKDGGRMRFFRRHGHGVSGHVFATALAYPVLMEAFGSELPPRQRAALAISLRTWIALVAWSRLRLDQHYLWNVLLGAAMGLNLSPEVARDAFDRAIAARRTAREWARRARVRPTAPSAT